ncbi:uncharacterized protein BBA_03906 [Beauveria bassiana ARSEF 2860]|uniref:Uncharacterized protein n=1 Tax=Beauveria bassiana (strain ARSEF 2860) TaxID=655819 RepID=J4UPY7_BEAB2|nr:uncharacterized protein BBA_03906 [Beauveria bassiana ARSEF 2860]EJP67332.1 hypothetical protein BBA_03906 [Beauveria bassiana ARSEF 2860]
MKRPASAEQLTPKRRRKSRGYGTASPSSRQGPPVPGISMNEAKASSQTLQKALQSHKMKPSGVPSLITNAKALESDAPVLATPPATSPTENLKSVIQKIPASSDLVDMDMSTGDAPDVAICEVMTAAMLDAMLGVEWEKEEHKGVGDDAEPALEKNAEPASEKNAEPASEKNAESDGTLAQALSHDSVPGNSQKPETGLDDAGNKDVEIITAPRQGSGSSPEDAMIVDSSPCKQLKHEHQLSQLVADADTGGSHSCTTPGTVVTTEWLLEKLNTLTPSTLSSDLAAIIQELRDLEAGLARLPRTTLDHPPVHLRRNGPAERLKLVEKLIGPQLSQIPARTWRTYKLKLLRLCKSPAVHNMDFRQRLDMVKEVVYLPEEVELLRRGNAERMGWAVRVCATVTEILGPEEEQVPEEMPAWVAAQLQEVAWKAKITTAWRKYWPEPEEMVID